jgi:hypothetical protein
MDFKLYRIAIEFAVVEYARHIVVVAEYGFGV